MDALDAIMGRKPGSCWRGEPRPARKPCIPSPASASASLPAMPAKHGMQGQKSKVTLQAFLLSHGSRLGMICWSVQFFPRRPMARCCGFQVCQRCSVYTYVDYPGLHAHAGQNHRHKLQAIPPASFFATHFCFFGHAANARRCLAPGVVPPTHRGKSRCTATVRAFKRLLASV